MAFLKKKTSLSPEAGPEPSLTLPATEQSAEWLEHRPVATEGETSVSEKDQPALAPPKAIDEGVSIHPIPKSLTLRQVESILEDDLGDIYFRLDVAHQRLFKEEGERASRQIEAVLATGKSIAVKVLTIIKKWLQLIPGVNKFFIEQEAKIKTDQITRLHTGFPK